MCGTADVESTKPELLVYERHPSACRPSVEVRTWTQTVASFSFLFSAHKIFSRAQAWLEAKRAESFESPVRMQAIFQICASGSVQPCLVSTLNLLDSTLHHATLQLAAVFIAGTRFWEILYAHEQASHSSE